MTGIYKIVNKINGKIYVGQAGNIKERWKGHEYKAFNKKEKGYSSAIHAAFRKYGIQNFSFEVIEECLPEELDIREAYWIKELDTKAPRGYNLTAGGQHIKKKFSRSIIDNEENEKICIIKERKPLYCSICGKPITRNSESGKCSSCWQLKVFITKEELEGKIKEYEGNFSEVGRFYGISDNAIRKKCRKYGIPSHASDYKEKEIKEKKQIKKSVFQIDSKTNEIIRKFESISEAAKFLGVSKGSHITEVCKGKGQTAYGYKWAYA